MIDIAKEFQAATGNGATHFEHEIHVRISFELKPEGRKFTLTGDAGGGSDEEILACVRKMAKNASLTRKVMESPDGHMAHPK